MKKVGVLRFPGTNCDQDVALWMKSHQRKVEFLWHLDQFSTEEFDLLILPGGFSYGDYLRSGALAARSPIMNSVRDFVQRGGPVLGICNGFQILCEAELLPGTLVQNDQRRFVDDWAELEISQPSSFFLKGRKAGDNLRLPIAHGDGRWFVAEKDYEKLYQDGQIWLRYKRNPNGSIYDVAGVFNKAGNVAGLMPHPERAYYSWMGGLDGWNFL